MSSPSSHPGSTSPTPTRISPTTSTPTRSWRPSPHGDRPFLGGRHPADRLAPLPIYGDLSGLKKVTTFVGTREIFLPDSTLFHAKLLEAGVDSTLHVGENLNHVYPMSPPRRDAGRAETSSAWSPVSSPDQPALFNQRCEAEAHEVSAGGLSPLAAIPRRAWHGYEPGRWSGCTPLRGNSATRTSARSRPEDGRREPRSCAPSPPAHR